MHFLPPPLPHSLTSLIDECDRALAMPPCDTLRAALALHRQGVITCPVTDTRYLPIALLNAAPHVLAALADVPELADAAAGADVSLRSAAWDDFQAPGSAHGIVPAPTVSADMFNDAADGERQVFLIIARVFLAQFYPPVRYWKDSDPGGRRILNPGWRRAMPRQEA
jgi:DNA topoisomerase-3